MKFLALPLVLLLCMYNTVTGNTDPLKTEQEIFTELAASFRAGNVKEISKYFGANVDVVLPSSDDQYSKSQAEIVLKNFFDSNPPTAFSIEHQGAGGNGKYMVGKLSTSRGTFKVYVFIKDAGAQKTISELKIENL